MSDAAISLGGGGAMAIATTAVAVWSSRGRVSNLWEHRSLTREGYILQDYWQRNFEALLSFFPSTCAPSRRRGLKALYSSKDSRGER